MTLCAFDLIELDGKDLRPEPIERRKTLLAQLVRKPLAGIVVNATFEEPGDVVFKHACALGCEGIVSKRLGSRYRAGRTRDWLKFKNPAAPAVKREAKRIGASRSGGERPRSTDSQARISEPAVRRRSEDDYDGSPTALDSRSRGITVVLDACLRLPPRP